MLLLRPQSDRNLVLHTPLDMNMTSVSERDKQVFKSFLHNVLTQNDKCSAVWPFVYRINTQTDSPEKATRWRVRVAVKSGVLRSQQEGQDSSSACTERVSYYHQPIVHGALVLQEEAGVITLTTAHFSHHSED